MLIEEPPCTPLPSNDLVHSGPPKTKAWRKFLVMYLVMVAVSTSAIWLLEHASIFSAFRTATVAAVGKTFAATWVSALFD